MEDRTQNTASNTDYRVVTPLLLTAYAVGGSKTVGEDEYLRAYADESGACESMIGDYNEYLRESGYESYEPMDDFNWIMESESPMDIALKIHCGDFNPNDDYFSFNGYGNLVSCSKWMLVKEISEDKDFLKNWYYWNEVDEDEMNEVIEECNKLLEQGY